MTKNQVNRHVKNLYKTFIYIKNHLTGDEYQKAKEGLNEKLKAITTTLGSIEALNRDNLIKLVAMQSSFRFMQPFEFPIYFGYAAEVLFPND